MSEQEEPALEEQSIPAGKNSKIVFLIKIVVILFCFTAFYGMYLGGQIRAKMDGQIWRLPAEVYSRIESISIHNKLTLDDTKRLLLDMLSPDHFYCSPRRFQN